MKRPVKTPVMRVQCKTCPFRDDGWTHVRPLLEQRALTEASPICHSTGKALVKCQGKAHICRGARNYQLSVFHRMGFLSEPTDEAWEKRCQDMGIG